MPKNIIAGETMSKKIDQLGKPLIFLASQPRAGSTLTQRLLAKHEQIATSGETWLMLPIVKSSMYDGHRAEYNARIARGAFRRFMIANDMDEIEGMRLKAWSIYEKVLAHHDSQYFLDKTPRYYEILSEIREIFPQSMIIILFRNPLAVLCSIISSWTGERWWELAEYHRDLLNAPQMLVDAAANDEFTLVLHYEKIVATPQKLSSVFEKLELAGLEDYESYRPPKREQQVFGDYKILKHKQVNKENLERWQEILSNPQIWRVVSDYLDYLGAELLNRMGYDYRDLRQKVDEKRPFFLWRCLTLPLMWLLDTKDSDKRRTLRFLIFRIGRALWIRIPRKRE